MRHKAQYVSIWDDGTEIRSNCLYDTETKEVSNIVTSDVEIDGSCEKEFLEFWTEEGEQIVDYADFINADIGETWEDKR